MDQPQDAPETRPEHDGRLTPEGAGGEAPLSAEEGAPAREGQSAPEGEAGETPHSDEEGALAYDGRLAPEGAGGEAPLSPEEGAPAPAEIVAAPESPAPAVSPSPAPESKSEDEEDDEEGMLRMSFLEHLEELRMRLVRALMGIGVAFAGCLVFAQQLWDAVRQPAVSALTQLNLPPDLAQITPMEAFSIVWVRVPILAATFISAPWILYQAWAFIAPGLYKKERRWATPFILSCAGLFILGGCFAYFVAFRFGLVFLLGIGPGSGIKPMVSVSEYFDLFVNVILGVALVFELPVLIFFLTLLRIANPRFLLRNSRYAILLITIAAAIITPTPDVVNLTIFAAPMVLLYFAGLFASYLLVLNREGKRFPWRGITIGILVFLALFAGSLILAITRYGFRLVPTFPYLTR
jgi:sec-independent protein translocase protein TatC